MLEIDSISHHNHHASPAYTCHTPIDVRKRKLLDTGALGSVRQLAG